MVLARHRTERTGVEGRETDSCTVHTYIDVLMNRFKRSVGGTGSPCQLACVCECVCV